MHPQYGPEYDIQDYVLASPPDESLGPAPAPDKASVLLKVRTHALVAQWSQGLSFPAEAVAEGRGMPLDGGERSMEIKAQI